mgnify:CR=1 FL=1
MREPRDFDAELKALEDKARGLKTRKVRQIGELVIATALALLAGVVAAGVLGRPAEPAPGRPEAPPSAAGWTTASGST